MNHEIIDTLAQYISTEILKQPKRGLRPDEPLISSGLIDSFSLVDIALHVENTYRVRIDDTELNAETFDSLEALAHIIQERMK